MTAPLQPSTQPWVIYCDGTATPNPGRMGLGAVITAPDGTQHTISHDTGARGCNNEAELLALMAALQALQRLGATALQAYCDNSLVIEQLDGRKAKPVARLAGLFDEARALLSGFDSVSLHWIPRHRNALADTLARAALGLPDTVTALPHKQRR